jgi:hypothetical protein
LECILLDRGFLSMTLEVCELGSIRESKSASNTEDIDTLEGSYGILDRVL